MYSKFLKEWIKSFSAFGIYHTSVLTETRNIHVRSSVHKEMIRLILSFDYSNMRREYVIRIGCICECSSITPLHLFMEFYFPGRGWLDQKVKVLYPSQLQKIFRYIILDIFHTANRYVDLYGTNSIEKIKVRLYDHKKKYNSYSNYILFSAFELIQLLLDKE